MNLAASGRAGLARRLVAGISGQVLLRVASALSALALVPLYIDSWGTKGFGEWVTLTALASYATYTNFGLVSTAGNEIVMLASAGRHDAAGRTFQLAINSTVYVLLPLFALIASVVAVIPLSSLFRLETVSNGAASAVVVLSIAQLFSDTLRGITASTINASGYYGWSYIQAGLARLTELAVVSVLLIFFKADFQTLALAMACVSVLDLVAITIARRRLAPWSKLDFGVFDGGWLKGQVKPGLGLVLGILSTEGTLLQGPRVLLGLLLGGEAVALYSVYSTTLRLLDQAVLLFAFPLEIEFAKEVGRNALRSAYRIVVVGTQVALIVLILGGTFILVFGPLIFSIWTRDRIPFVYPLMLLFMTLSAATQVGRISSHAIMATNRMFRPGVTMFAVTMVALGLAGVLTTIFGIPGMIAGAALGELAASAIVISTLTRWLGAGPVSFTRDLFETNSVFSYLGKMAKNIVVRT